MTEHGIPEVVEEKQKEVQNLEDYETYEEVQDERQETIRSRWVITR